MSWSNQSKNTSTYSNQSKHTSTFNISAYLLCESGDALLQESGYWILLSDSPGDKHYGDWSDSSKSSSTFSKQSKNTSAWVNQAKN